MVNQQHQQGIKAANEKGRQRCQLEVGDAVTSQERHKIIEGIWSGIQDWLSRRQVQVASAIIWCQHINQLRPLQPLSPLMYEELHLIRLKSVKQRWSAYHQWQSNKVYRPILLEWFQRYPWQINCRWLLFQHLQLRILQTWLQPALWSRSDGTPRECAKHCRDFISELY